MEPLNKIEQTLMGLPAAAQKLYRRLQEGHFYKAFGEGIPKAMEALENAGLVGVAGRPTRITTCYVPMHGFTPWVPEKFDEAPTKEWTRNELIVARVIAFLSAERHKQENPTAYAVHFAPQFIAEAKRVLTAMEIDDAKS